MTWVQPRALEQPENPAEHVRYDKQHLQNNTISPAALIEAYMRRAQNRHGSTLMYVAGLFVLYKGIDKHASTKTIKHHPQSLNI
jgi:hypothetical protein